MKSPALAGMVAVIIWGASPAATMLAATSIPPELIGGLRSMIAAALMLPGIFWFWSHLPTGARARVELFGGGAAGFALYPFFLSIGVTQTSVSHASLLLAAAPIFTGLISFVLTQNWPRPAWWGGAAIAMSGVAFLVSATATDAAATKATIYGDGLVLLSVLFASVGYIFGSRSSAKMGKWPATFWMLVTGALIFTPFLLGPAVSFDWAGASLQAVSGLAFLVIAVTIIGYALWFWALGAGDAAKIAPLQFGQPLVGVGLAAAFFGEPITAIILLSGALIVLGVVVSNRT